MPPRDGTTQEAARASAHLLIPRLDRDVADEARRQAESHGGKGEVDGRKVRGLRNRDAVVDAIISLLGDGNVNPTAKEIADRANVSLRSVFRHFEDLDSLFLAAIERQGQRTAHLYEPPVQVGTLEVRTDSLVARRRKLYETIFDVRRGWMLRYYDQPRVSAILDDIYRALHAQVVTLYQADLEKCTPTVQREVVDAIDTATSFDNWAHLRSHRGLSAARSAAVVRRTILSVLDDAIGD